MVVTGPLDLFLLFSFRYRRGYVCLEGMFAISL